MRQGDPLSSYLFATAADEILAIPIRNRDSIKEIKINGLETKLLQFADDTTAILSNLNYANAFFSLLEDFEKASGLKLNQLKRLKVLKQCGLVLLGAVKINHLELNGKHVLNS